MLMVNVMVRVNIPIQMVTNTRVISRIISSMVLVDSPMPIAVNTMVCNDCYFR
jgi:hypothetical protein